MVFVKFLLQGFDEFLLEAVELIDVAKNSAQLLLGKHVCPLPTLFYIALEAKINMSSNGIADLRNSYSDVNQVFLSACKHSAR